MRPRPILNSTGPFASQFHPTQNGPSICRASRRTFERVMARELSAKAASWRGGSSRPACHSLPSSIPVGIRTRISRFGLRKATSVPGRALVVVAMGEFGRTPKLNAAGGRDHWPRAFSVALAGGGVRGGQVVGASDRAGESPSDRPVTPADLARTIYTLLGVDPDRVLHTTDGRPVPVNRGGAVIRELLA